MLWITSIFNQIVSINWELGLIGTNIAWRRWVVGFEDGRSMLTELINLIFSAARNEWFVLETSFIRSYNAVLSIERTWWILIEILWSLKWARVTSLFNTVRLLVAKITSMKINLTFVALWRIEYFLMYLYCIYLYVY